MNLAQSTIVDLLIQVTICKKVHLLARSAFILFDFGNDYVNPKNFLQMQLFIDFTTRAD